MCGNLILPEAIDYVYFYMKLNLRNLLYVINGMANDSYLIIPIQSTNKLLTGGNFGVETALPAIIGYIAVALMIGFLVKKEFKKWGGVAE